MNSHHFLYKCRAKYVIWHKFFVKCRVLKCSCSRNLYAFSQTTVSSASPSLTSPNIFLYMRFFIISPIFPLRLWFWFGAFSGLGSCSVCHPQMAIYIVVSVADFIHIKHTPPKVGSACLPKLTTEKRYISFNTLHSFLLISRIRNNAIINFLDDTLNLMEFHTEVGHFRLRL